MSFGLQIDTEPMRRALREKREAVVAGIPQLMETIGVAVLSEAQLSYIEKARGGVGSEGVAWDPLTRATLEARVGRVGRGRRIIQKRKDLARQIRQLEDSRPRSRGPGAPGTKEGRKAAREQARGTERQIERLRAKRKKLRADFERLVDAAVANHEIGVDTGLQRASAQPGFRGGDGEGGNHFELRANEVTVGFSRSYSGEFDRTRPLLPEDLPASWRENLAPIIDEWADDIMNGSAT